jgi:hypothetical protein
MSDRLKGQDVEVVGGDLLVSIPGDGTVILDGADVLELAAQKGRVLEVSEDGEDADSSDDGHHV